MTSSDLVFPFSYSGYFYNKLSFGGRKKKKGQNIIKWLKKYIENILKNVHSRYKYKYMMDVKELLILNKNY